MKKSSLFITTIITIAILISTIYLFKTNTEVTSMQYPFATIENRPLMDSDKEMEKNLLTFLQQAEQKLHAQKDFFYTIAEDLTEEQLVELADDLVVYKIRLNQMNYRYQTNTPLTGEFELVVSEMASELLTDNTIPIYADLWNKVKEQKIIEQITPLNGVHFPPQVIEKANENIYQYYTNDISVLPQQKLQFQISEELLKKTGLSSSIIDITLREMESNHQVYPNVQIYEDIHRIGYLNDQNELLTTVLEKAIALYPHPEKLVEFIDSYTTYSIVLTDLLNKTKLENTEYDISNYSAISVVVENPILWFLPMEQISVYANQIQTLTNLNISPALIHNSIFLDKSKKLLVFLNHITPKNDSTITVQVNSQLASKANLDSETFKLIYNPIDFQLIYKDSLPYSEMETKANLELRLEILTNLLTTYAPQLTEQQKNVIRKKLVHYDLVLNDTSVDYSPLSINNTSQIKVVQNISSLLIDEDSPYYAQEILNRGILNDITTDDSFDPFSLTSDTASQFGFEIRYPIRSNEELTFHLSENYQTDGTLKVQTPITIKIREHEPTIGYFLFTNPEGMATYAHGLYLHEQTNLLAEAANTLVNSIENKQELTNFIHQYSIYKDVRIIDNQINETITQKTYEVDETPTIEIHFVNPAFLVLNYFHNLLPEGNLINEDIILNKEITSLKIYPFFDLSEKFTQIYNLQMEENQFPLEVTFSNNLVDNLYLPFNTITLKERK